MGVEELMPLLLDRPLRRLRGPVQGRVLDTGGAVFNAAAFRAGAAVDEQAVRDAITEAAFVGGEVLIPHCNFAPDATIELPIGVKLTGIGYGSLIATTAMATGFPVFRCLGNNKVSGLRGVGIAENKNASAFVSVGESFTQVEDVEIFGLLISGFLDGIVLYSGSGVQVHHNRIMNTYAHGVRYADLLDSIISYNRITGAGNGGNGDGIKGLPSAFGSTTDPVEDSDDVLIEGNIVSGCSRDGIDVASGFNHLTIRGNKCRANTLNGIEVKVALTYTGLAIGDADLLRVVDNDCDNNLAAGIRADAIYRPYIEDNRCSGNGTEGILYVNGSLKGRVKGNTCDSNLGSGIRVLGNVSEGDVDHLDITENTCVDNGNGSNHGIHLDGLADHVRVWGNRTYQTSAGKTNAGILVDVGCTNVHVWDNYAPAELVDAALPIQMPAQNDVYLGVNQITESGGAKVIADGDTTPDIGGNNGRYITNNVTATTTITDFGGAPGGNVAPFTIIINDANTRFNHTAGQLELAGGVNWTTAAAGDTITFVCEAGVFYEVGRAV